jgi:hypothetical protein
MLGQASTFLSFQPNRVAPTGHEHEALQRASFEAARAIVLGGAMHEQQRRPLADALVGDLEPVRTDDLRRRNLQV